MADGGDSEHLRDWIGKLPSATVRIAAVFHCIHHANGNLEHELIGTCDMLPAIALGKSLRCHATKAFSIMSGGGSSMTDVKAVLTWIHNDATDSFRVRDLHNGLQSRFPTRKELDAPLKVLEERGYIQRVDSHQTGRGRRSEVYRVHPLIGGYQR